MIFMIKGDSNASIAKKNDTLSGIKDFKDYTKIYYLAKF